MNKRGLEQDEELLERDLDDEELFGREYEELFGREYDQLDERDVFDGLDDLD